MYKVQCVPSSFSQRCDGWLIFQLVTEVAVQKVIVIFNGFLPLSFKLGVSFPNNRSSYWHSILSRHWRRAWNSLVPRQELRTGTGLKWSPHTTFICLCDFMTSTASSVTFIQQTLNVCWLWGVLWGLKMSTPLHLIPAAKLAKISGTACLQYLLFCNVFKYV